MELVQPPLLKDRGMVEGVEGYTGCPTAADLAVILGVVANKTASRLTLSLSGTARHGSPQEVRKRRRHCRVSGRRGTAVESCRQAEPGLELPLRAPCRVGERLGKKWSGLMAATMRRRAASR